MTTTSPATSDASVEPTLGSYPIGNRLAFWGLVVFIAGYCVVLLSAFGIQFISHEFPCPLCMLQRYAMILATIPIVWIVAESLRGRLTRVTYLRSLGMSIVASVAGSIMSTRQILLHIASKTDPGYGSAVLGLHLYTWALITFQIVIVYCGASMMLNGQAIPEAPSSPKVQLLARAVLWLFLAVLVANVIAIIFLEGFSRVLPDNPTSYHLLHQF